MTPSDFILTGGNDMLRAPMSYRCRWFEYLAYRPLLEKYYDEDPNMRWASAPKPRLTSTTYKSNYLPEGITEEDRYKKIEHRDMILTEQEPLFDEDEVLRFRKDLFYHKFWSKIYCHILYYHVFLHLCLISLLILIHELAQLI